jgi:hypothetical protein
MIPIPIALTIFSRLKQAIDLIDRQMVPNPIDTTLLSFLLPLGWIHHSRFIYTMHQILINTAPLISDLRSMSNDPILGARIPLILAQGEKTTYKALVSPRSLFWWLWPKDSNPQSNALSQQVEALEKQVAALKEMLLIASVLL